MQIYRHIREWQSIRAHIPAHLSIGFVPTMGNLHVGHASLLAKSKCENDLTVASIFINPTQFNQPEDYTNYPRTLEADLALLENNQVDYCIIPHEHDIYSDGNRYQIHENKLSEHLEGEFRQGHFAGVLTVVMKLLNIVKPQRSYFGEKDYQQFQLIRDMVSAFFMDIAVIPCPTIRESSGLPYSSRNNRLNEQERKLADQFAMIFHQPLACEEITQKLTQLGIRVDYIREYNNRRFAAVHIGPVRLIDNYPLAV